MSDLPKFVEIKEEGPREGFQIEKGPISTARKVEFIDALSKTGLKTIQTVSFVNPKKVPAMADAEDVVAGMTLEPGVTYTGLWLNDQGYERAKATGKLAIKPAINLCASEAFSIRNTNRDFAKQVEGAHASAEKYKSEGIEITGAGVSAAFGCNFEGDIPVSKIVALAEQSIAIAAEHGHAVKRFSMLDTMGWATPIHIKRAVDAVREKFPDLELSLHLHDTRGLGIANAYAGLEMGVAHYDSCVAGLGGCPFAGNKAAAGNVCTEDLVFMCEEMGIETGLDLDALTECALLAEDVVGHPLPGSVMKGGTLKAMREKLASA